MDDERIDFSALDPKRDSRRFERMVEAVLFAARPSGRPPIMDQLVRSGRTALALAALLAVTAWLPKWLGGDSTSAGSPAAMGHDSVELVSGWAQTGKVPPDVDLIQTIGTIYER
jgi:hypothetical protein